MQIKIICSNCLKVINTIDTCHAIKYIAKNMKAYCTTCEKSIHVEFCFSYPYVSSWCDSCDSKYICYSTLSKDDAMLSEITSSILEQSIKKELDQLISFIRKTQSTAIVIWE